MDLSQACTPGQPVCRASPRKSPLRWRGAGSWQRVNTGTGSDRPPESGAPPTAPEVPMGGHRSAEGCGGAQSQGLARTGSLRPPGAGLQQVQSPPSGLQGGLHYRRALSTAAVPPQRGQSPGEGRPELQAGQRSSGLRLHHHAGVCPPGRRPEWAQRGLHGPASRNGTARETPHVRV